MSKPVDQALIRACLQAPIRTAQSIAPLATRRFSQKPRQSPAAFYARYGIKLKHAGWNKALCPFHDDKHPSMSVNVEHGGFRCFVCEAHGDMVEFYQLKHGVSLKEALRAVEVD